MSQPSHYIFQVVPLLRECKDNLQATLSQIQFFPGRYKALYRLQSSLYAAEKHIIDYVVNASQSVKNPKGIHDYGDILRALEYLKQASRKANASKPRDCESNISKQRSRPQNPRETPLEHQFQRNKTGRSVDSQLVFQLVVVLQLLLVRIDDAHYVIAGYRMDELSSDSVGRKRKDENPNFARKRSRGSSNLSSIGFCCLGVGLIAGVLGRKCVGERHIKPRVLPMYFPHGTSLLLAATKAGGSLAGLVLFRNFINTCWMTDKIVRSSNELSEWSKRWNLVHGAVGDRKGRERGCFSPSTVVAENELPRIATPKGSIDADRKARILIECAKKNNFKAYFWSSTGEIRFFILKRFMDIYYASIGAGVHCTKEKPNSFFLPLVAGVAACFYTITGAPTPSIVNDDASCDLIRHAWGMVSLPLLKNLTLRASRMIKGASVADRIVLGGVSCFVLSKDPAPELAGILRSQARKGFRNSLGYFSQLPTIDETETHQDEGNPVRKKIVGSKGQHHQRDVILHLTGGGFFAHTIASDLPYLLDWSSSTGAVVICPEYSLLPENQFPVQLNQIFAIYKLLATGNTGTSLGFDANSIIVTGESVGGNLAAALCVKLAMGNIQAEGRGGNLDESSPLNGGGDRPKRMPDAIVLSCPALNLATEVSRSRSTGTEDPVLPSALLSAISDAYVSSERERRHPLASPCYAPDEILRRFPPALLFAGARDPLLDDSLAFHERLRLLGVDSEIVAVNNVPHAYLGLGTAGFPGAVRVQQYAVDWMAQHLR